MECIWVEADGASRRRDFSSPDHVGQKAYGLLQIPAAWTPPFIVVSFALFASFKRADSGDRKKLLDPWCASIREGLAIAGIPAEDPIIVRSNAQSESLSERGLLQSTVTRLSSMAPDLEGLLESTLRIEPTSNVGFIVQAYVDAHARGHLSNERRVREEARDGLIELEDVVTGSMTEIAISYRNWRRTTPPSDQSLLCSTESDIRAALREPLAFAACNKRRMNFEWIWSGTTAYVVQADEDTSANTGTRPDTVVGNATKEPATVSLLVFRPIREMDRDKSSKLANHFQYQDAGFWQPTFYILDNPSALAGIVEGRLNDAIRQDLAILTQSLLVIRSSCQSRQVHLLPRSHLLASVDDAESWLLGAFSTEVRTRDIDPKELLLIAHHYVPAVACAFSEGSAQRQDVRIEASWGVPESLYYYPCDTYVVNTLIGDIDNIGDDLSRFTMRTLSRGPKRYFVAPDRNSGHFVRHQVAPPFDWKPTIGDQSTLNLVAAYTRRLSGLLGYPVNLMWFIDCRTDDGPYKAIPWYSEHLEDRRVERYRKNAKDTVFGLSTEAHLRQLEEGNIPNYSPSQRGSLVIDLNPADNAVLRDTQFAERVGRATAKLGGLIVLNGGTLSHVYYILQRSGANVCSRSIAVDDGDREAHKKLVRDRIPDFVRSSGETAVVKTLTKREREAALRIKLLEEALEAKDALSPDLLSELADVIEVVRALGQAHGIAPEQIESARAEKAAKRGGFDEGILLVETLTKAIRADLAAEDTQLDLLSEERDRASRATSSDAATFDHGWRDFREGADYWEVIERATIPIWHKEWSIDSRGGYDPPHKDSRHLSWELFGRREGPFLKLKLRIRLGHRQLTLNLPLEA